MNLRLIVSNKLLNVLFQPIYDYGEKKIIGYEALSRGPKGSNYEGAKELFGAAKNEGVQGMLEMACFRKALFEYRSKLFKSEALLFLNFHPDILVDYLEEILCELDGCRERTVIEITEAADLHRAYGCVDRLKLAGVGVALDDVGVGERSIANLCEANFDFLKIDKSVVRGIVAGNGSAAKYGLLMRFMVNLAIQSGARVIAEGIETAEQVFEIKKAGVNLMQGFYFAKPVPAEYWIGRKMESL